VSRPVEPVVTDTTPAAGELRLRKPLPPTVKSFALRFGAGPSFSLSPDLRAASASLTTMQTLLAIDWAPAGLSLPLTFRLAYEHQRSGRSVFRDSSIELTLHHVEPSAAWTLASGIDWSASARLGLALDAGQVDQSPAGGERLSASALGLGAVAALGGEIAPNGPESVGWMVGGEVAWRQSIGGLRFRGAAPAGLGDSDPARIPVTPSDLGTLDPSGVALRLWAGLRF